MDFEFGEEEEEGETTTAAAAAAAAPIGGYDYLFLEEPPSDVICPICRLVAREPQQVSCCGKIYCRSCLSELESQSRWRTRCANCRQDEPESFPDRKTAGQINSLRVACIKREDGCIWRGALREVDTHLSRCEYADIVCPFNSFGCHYRPLRKDLEDHENDSVHQHLKLALKHVEKLEKTIKDHSCDQRQQLTQMDASIKELKGIHQMHKKELKKQLEKRMENQANSLCTKLDSIKSDVMAHARPLPQVFKLDGFSDLQDDDEDWHSPAFFTRPGGGYRMCLRVYTNGCSEVRGTHLSLYIYLMKSEHDHALEWPFRGTIHVEILNQLQDNHHYSEKVTFTSRELKNYNSRVKFTSSTGMGVTGLGKSRFISLIELEHNDGSCQYLRDDAIYFRVSKVEVNSISRPWLAHVEEQD